MFVRIKDRRGEREEGRTFMEEERRIKIRCDKEMKEEAEGGEQDV